MNEQDAKEQDAKEHGQKLLSAVERFVAAPELIIAVVRDIELRTRDASENDPWLIRRRVSDGVIKRYADNAAVSAAAAAVPAMLPGVGTLMVITGGALVDMALTLKFEVELALALTHVYGFDIHLEEERQRALLMAAVRVYEEKNVQNFFVDVLEAQTTAIWKYGPRQASKLLITVMSRLAIVAVSKGFVRSVPILGAVVGASINKLMTSRVGVAMRDQLEVRRQQTPEGQDDGPDVVDARVD